ncbi:YpoC family protein [Aquibacillus kalidii]|uniref:YpoC family protein n=1 Tax=Aquibacillus kalidii TaxID=2762597 RepID=UPI001648C8F8|nr:hypothetical protein [Aquibacillus kalidii]
MFNEGKSLIEEWKSNREEVSKLFNERRNQEAKAYVEKYLSQFINVLLIVNSQQHNENRLAELDSDFKYAPANVMERIHFIKEHPQQYHSYIQLNELFKEIEKIYAKAIIIEANKH